MTAELSYTGNLQWDLQNYEHDHQIVDNAIDSMESMMAMGDMLMQGDPGLDPTAYKIATTAMESFMRMSRIGLPRDSVVPAIESYSNGKFVLGQATLEGMGEGIKNVFMSILNAIKAAFKWMGGLIMRLFGFRKERQESIAKMKDEAAEIKDKVEKMSDDEKRAGPARTSTGWINEIKLDNPQMLLPMITSHGLMDREYFNKLAEELKAVFEFQIRHSAHAMENLKKSENGPLPAESGDYKLPLAETRDPNILSAFHDTAGTDVKVYASHEFGNGTYAAVAIPFMRADGASSERDMHKASQQWADGIHFQKVVTGKVQSPEKFATLKGDLCDGDVLIATVEELEKQLNWFTDRLKALQSAKGKFINQFEAMIKKHGGGLFSSNEKKTMRDDMVFRLKFFKKTMDQPALMYFGMCNELVGAYERLSKHVLHFNDHGGNKMAVAAKEAK